MSTDWWQHLEALGRDLGARTAVRTQVDLSFLDLYETASTLAQDLERAGIRPGQVVGVTLPNGPAFVAAVLALFQMPTTAALVSPRYSESELGTIAREAGVAAFLTGSAYAGRVATMLGGWKEHPLHGDVFGQGLVLVVSKTRSGQPAPPECQNAAVLKLTSGSTGALKGIALGPEQVLAEARNITDTLGLGPDDRILADVPLFHSYGFDLGVLPLLFSGARLVLQDFFVPRRIADDLGREEATVFLGVPNMYRRWLEAAPPGAVSLPRLRYLLSCTAPLDAATILSFHARFQLPICQHYGSSETGGVTNHVPDQVLERPDSIGLPLRNVQIRLVDSRGHEVTPGQEGEIMVVSPAAASGYVFGAPAERQVFRAGGFLTGDLAVQEAAGFLTLRGRKDHVINVGGLKVSPEEVRRVLESHPSVREAGVIGTKDRAGEEAVAAMVALRSPASEKELIAFCYRELADYKVPRRIHIGDVLPRGPTGKVRLRAEDLPL